jgi:hypothetical protein
MTRYTTICLFIILSPGCTKDDGVSENQIKIEYPEFIEETEVEINGYSSHAMEPFITKDGFYLFFNDSNDAVYTSLHYATRVNDTVFNYNDEITGVNGAPPHLDAVASMDENNVFFFVSTRDYPATIENYQTGIFSGGAVTEVRSVKGNFYIDSPGWIIMDAEINKSGNNLYYTNSYFNGESLPEQSILGIANKIDSTFNKITLSENILSNINNPNYLIYAPSILSDQKELYFTRIRKGTTVSEICVSVRPDTNKSFSVPKVIEIAGIAVEAPSLTAEGERIYYHKISVSDSKFHIFTMKRK